MLLPIGTGIVVFAEPSACCILRLHCFAVLQRSSSDWHTDSSTQDDIARCRTIVRNVLVPLPPTKAEQEAIAEALSDADALIESLEQLLAKKRQLKQGAMQELLTGKKRLPGFSGEWEVKDWEVRTASTIGEIR